MKNIRGQFGNYEVKSFPFTFELNEKEGMDKDEFQYYLFINIIPLYADAEDVQGKWILLKPNSRRGKFIPS